MCMKKVVYRETSKFCLVCRKQICKLELELISDFFVCVCISHKQTVAGMQQQLWYSFGITFLMLFGN